MSRIGRMPIAIPQGVEVKLAGAEITVKGPKGTLSRTLHGLTRTLINNMVIGVTEGYTKTLEINGVGYRASKQGNKLTLNLGFSHTIEMIDPEGVTSEVSNDQVKIVIKGINKQAVGEYAAKIRSKRKPEPYKGKGIKYSDEVVRRKEGKSAAKK